ncbi:DUF4347 domain-containing protein [filamentous cyanobacterium LEGE 11480]|uniref:DUF4347 domain-containing protein n=1 Tax=Romeriopsis navalis LEGE 11480 TaxID=2777977 RepID=A0A928VIW2_9CYAN|nr:PA14 domain-containing protein [Romeriopsis navalis]MBE9028497.1 DUF4347 domain-containing protein [Romeriopsis navalis LEGE 11480]
MQVFPDSQLSLEAAASSAALGTINPQSLVFIDTNLNAYQSLAASVVGAEVVLLDHNEDGIEQITTALADRRDIGAIHLISHGTAGALQLGNSQLSANRLNQYAAQLQSWEQALTDDADILLYGCDVAAAGRDFIDQLSQLTGADIAASTDLTGNAQLGGDWELEVSTGAIDATLALSQSIQGSYQGVFAGFDYDNFNSIAGIQTNGNASQAGNRLRLTPNENNQAGSAFYNTAFEINGSTSFNTQFQFRLSGSDGTAGADGFTFVIQNDSNGAAALGSSGGSVGYAGIGNSIAIEFDTYDNGSSDPNNNHLSLLVNGSTTGLSNASTSIDLNSGSAINAWVDYDGATNQLDVYLATGNTKPATALLSETIDLAATVGSKAYFGFTGGTGGLRNIQEIQNWELDTNATPITGGGNPGTGTGLLGEYFDDLNFTNSQLIRTDSTVNFNWGTGSPDPVIGNDTFSVRWSGEIEAQYNETYTFYTTTDDGVRLRINGNLIVDQFVDQASTTSTGSITLAADQKYDIVLEYYENGGGADAKLEWSSASQARQVVPTSQLYAGAAPPPPPPPTGSGDGLTGTYYDNINFTNEVLSRVDNTVSFDWGTGSPASNIGNDTFSVVWTGQVQPIYSEAYTFFTTTDDGVKLFIDGQQVINQFQDQAPTTVNGTPIVLVADQKYDIRMEYFENGGGAVAQLGWESASQNRQIVPQVRLFSDSGSSSFGVAEPTVSISETAGAVTVTVNRTGDSSTAASVDYATTAGTATAGSDFTGSNGTLNFAAGDTSATVSIPILNDTVIEPTETFSLALSNPTAGTTLGTNSSTTISILDDDAPTGNGDGLTGTYYNNIDFTNEVLSRVDSTVDFNWGSGSPASGIGVNTFSVVWTGQVQAIYDETYTFFTTTDDGVRLFVNGQPVIDQFQDQGPTLVNGTPIALQAGEKYDIRMEYYENGGGAVAQLGWSSASQISQIIPQSQLFSTGGSGLPGVFEVDVTGVTVSEGDATATVTVNRVNGSSGVATVDYVTNEDTATRDVDFTYQTGTLTFADGETSKTVDITILEDTIVEPTESFGFAILGATGAALGTKRTVSVNILDNDAANSSFTFSQSAYELKEDGGQAAITVTRSGNTNGSASVNYATSDGTATAGSDYTATTGTLNFANGETSKIFNINVINDVDGERNESVNLQLSNPIGGTIGAQSTAIFNILDNDPGSFNREALITGLTTPTALEWTPDGQTLFISEQNGLVKVADAATGVLQSTPFIDLRSQVNGVRDRGLLGMTLDPDFNGSRPYVYLLFTYDPPEAADPTRPGYNPTFGGQDKAGNRPARLIRVEAELVNGNYQVKAGSEIILLGKNSNFANTRGFDANSTLPANANIPASGFVRDTNGNNTAESIQDYLAGDSESHSVGSVQFGADGKLYVTIGDGTSYNFADPRTVRVQDIDNLSGKMLRIDPDTGNGLADNPFYNVTTGSPFDTQFNNDPTSNRSKVFNLGLRNPFRFTFDPTTNLPVIGDVGWFNWEEINTGAGKNFGWPAYEGGLDSLGNPINLRTANYQNLPQVTPFYPGGSQTITAQTPLFAFEHQSGGGDAVIMGDFYTGNTFPVFYDNALFYTNASRGTVNTVFFDQTGQVSGTQLFADNLFGITELETGPDGSLYYVNLGVPIGGTTGTGSIGRWVPTTGNGPNAPINRSGQGNNPTQFVPGLFSQTIQSPVQ